MPPESIESSLAAANGNTVVSIYLTEVATVYSGKGAEELSTQETHSLLEVAREVMACSRTAEAFTYELVKGELVIDEDRSLHFPEDEIVNSPKILTQLEHEKRKTSPSFDGLVTPDKQEFMNKHGYSVNDLLATEKAIALSVFPKYRILSEPRNMLVKRVVKRSDLERKRVETILDDYGSSKETIAPSGIFEYTKIYGRKGSVGRHPFLTISSGVTFVGLFTLARAIPIRVTEEVFWSPIGPRTEKVRAEHAKSFEVHVRQIVSKSGFAASEISEFQCPTGQIDCVGVHETEPLCIVIECKTSAFVPELRQFLPKTEVLLEWEQKLREKMDWAKKNLPELEKQLLGRVIAGERKVLGLFVTERPLFSQNSSHIQVVTIYELGAYLEAIQSNARRLVPQ